MPVDNDKPSFVPNWDKSDLELIERVARGLADYDEQTTAALTQLSSHTEPLIRLGVVLALARIFWFPSWEGHCEFAVHALKRLAEDLDPQVKLAACDALLAYNAYRLLSN